MSSDCPLKGEQCIKRFQNQAFWGLHSFGSNFAVISPSWVKCMKEGRGKWGCLRGIPPRHWSKSGFINKENKTWNLTYIGKKNGSTASYSIFSEHKSKLIHLQDFSEQWSSREVSPKRPGTTVLLDNILNELFHHSDPARRFHHRHWEANWYMVSSLVITRALFASFYCPTTRSYYKYIGGSTSKFLMNSVNFAKTQ